MRWRCTRRGDGNPADGSRTEKGETFSSSFYRLADRCGSGLDEILLDETRRLEELKGVINRKSREVFERIFMGEVMNRLYRDLLQIEDLVRRIQKKLTRRRFRSNRYTFELTPVPAYVRFVIWRKPRTVGTRILANDSDVSMCVPTNVSEKASERMLQLVRKHLGINRIVLAKLMGVSIKT